MTKSHWVTRIILAKHWFCITCDGMDQELENVVSPCLSYSFMRKAKSPPSSHKSPCFFRPWASPGNLLLDKWTHSLGTGLNALSWDCYSASCAGWLISCLAHSFWNVLFLDQKSWKIPSQQMPWGEFQLQKMCWIQLKYFPGHWWREWS